MVTGAASGLGRQLALQLSAEGAAIAALDLNADGLASLAGELAGRPIAWATGDVTNRDSLRAAVALLQERLGPVDLLVANAGIGRETNALDFRAADVEAQVAVNLIGVANSIEAVLPGMLQRRFGHLVAISSLASYHGLPKMGGYCASKAGVNALIEGLRLELKAYNIHTTIICPGWIRTPLTDNIGVAKPYIMEADYAARQIVAAIRQKRLFFAFPPPALWRVRLLRWLPAGLSDWMAARAARRFAKP